MAKSKSPALDMIAAAARRPEPAPVAEQITRSTSKRAPIREDRFNVSAWLPVDFKKNIRTVQSVYPEKTLQDLIAEALNDLFSKYNVPTVSEPGRPGPRPRGAGRAPN